MTIADKLQLTLDTKQAIKQALIDKGAEPSDVFSTYADEVRDLPSGDEVVGTIVDHRLDENVEGFLPCDGSLVNLAAYPEVADYLPTSKILQGWTEAEAVTGTPTLSGTGRGATFSPDGEYLAVAHTRSRYLTVIRTSDWSTVPGTPTLANHGYGTAFSPDGEYLVVAHVGSPFLTVIRTSDWSTVPGTPTLPGNGNSAAFSPDGEYIAVAHTSSPFLTVIRTSDWSTVAGTLTLPNTGNGAAFSPDGAYLAVAHGSSPYITVLSSMLPAPEGYGFLPMLPAKRHGNVIAQPLIRVESL